MQPTPSIPSTSLSPARRTLLRGMAGAAVLGAGVPC